MGLDVSQVRGIVERVFARQDVLAACSQRDLGVIVAVLGTHGVTQGQISELTGIGQGRLSEWVRHKRTPSASSTFEAFADGLAIPPRARQALGLAPVPSGGLDSGAVRSPGGGATLPAQTLSGAARPAAAGLSRLHGLEEVRSQLEVVIAVLKAERDRRTAGLAVRRPTWKNLVFTGPPGSGKSRTAIAVGQTYRKLGVLSNGRVLQVTAADLVGAGPEETGKLVGKAAKLASGGILMINEAHAWDRLPDRGLQALRRLHESLSEYRDTLNDDLAVILAGQAERLSRLLHEIPPLAARFRAVIDFPRLHAQTALGDLRQPGRRRRAEADHRGQVQGRRRACPDRKRPRSGQCPAGGRTAEPGDRGSGPPSGSLVVPQQDAGRGGHDQRGGHPGLPASRHGAARR